MTCQLYDLEALPPTGPLFDGGGRLRRDLVLWDGDCGFCRRVVLWLLRRDTAGRFVALPYQAAPSPPMTPELSARCERAVHVLTADGRELRAGRASLHILEHLGWGRWARLLALPPLVWLVEAGYWIVARNRGFFSRFLFRRRTSVS